MWEQDTGGGRMCVCVLWEVRGTIPSIRAQSHPNVYSLPFTTSCVCTVDTICRGPDWLPLRAHLTRSDNIVYKLWSKCSFCLHSADVFLHSQRMNMNWAMVKCICANTTVKFHAATLATKILTYVEECIFCGN